MSRMFAISDLHGMYDIFEQVNKILLPDDIVYFIGDATDRGPKGWELMKAIWNHRNWVYLKGNHEDMLYNAWREYEDYGMHEYDYALLMDNGGNSTWESAIIDHQVKDWMQIVNSMPVYTDVINKDGIHIHLCHSGYLPANPGKRESYHVKHDMLWDRRHYLFKWQDEVYGEDIVVHGHTPIPYIIKDRENIYNSEWEYGAYWYSEGKTPVPHKCCIDNGTYNTGVACLLDLDTFDEHIFQSNMKINN